MQAACYSLNLIHAIPYSSKICNDSLCEDMEELMGKYFPTDLESREELPRIKLISTLSLLYCHTGLWAGRGKELPGLSSDLP